MNCPACNSNNIKCTSTKGPGPYQTINCKCLDCGHNWTIKKYYRTQ
ncbi:hypothetical protein GOV04_02880 [Candidatus Woesearchaeota archaeon]|nr:hypothetical protein [Candidatus Woesearchaeota archaeon]